jgi:hypothetical protein
MMFFRECWIRSPSISVSIRSDAIMIIAVRSRISHHIQCAKAYVAGIVNTLGSHRYWTSANAWGSRAGA